MLKLRRMRAFDKELKKVGLSSELIEVLYCLTHNQPLADKYRDHSLSGNWKGFRDCHIKPDLVLIYRVNNQNLELHRLNSHSELFG
ncbi:MAG: type II toxin-antitoxin system YafQ family toxin [Gammaproteobacteria bacterium]|nr:type II toxin-antitoxin system YafQ family toxin [Gammaproteobacteria bacterium]